MNTYVDNRLIESCILGRQRGSQAVSSVKPIHLHLCRNVELGGPLLLRPVRLGLGWFLYYCTGEERPALLRGLGRGILSASLCA